MAADGGFGFPVIPGIVEDSESQDVVIPAIYQRVVPRQSDYHHEAEESEEEDPEEYDLDLTAPPLES